MFLCSLAANQYSNFYGPPDAPIVHATAVVTIAQTPTCDSFLLLTGALDPALVQHGTVPEGYDFTYCQAWGLTIDDAVANRVIQDVRKNAYPPMADYLDGIVKSDAAQVQTYVDACLAVKARYPKGF